MRFERAVTGPFSGIGRGARPESVGSDWMSAAIHRTHRGRTIREEPFALLSSKRTLRTASDRVRILQVTPRRYGNRCVTGLQRRRRRWSVLLADLARLPSICVSLARRFRALLCLPRLPLFELLHLRLRRRDGGRTGDLVGHLAVAPGAADSTSAAITSSQIT